MRDAGNNSCQVPFCCHKGRKYRFVNKDLDMRKLMSTLCATALAASVAAAGVLSANAAPVFVHKAPAAEQTGVIQIGDRGNGPIWKKRFRNSSSFNSNNNFRGRNWNGSRNNNYGWYNGHRGYRYKRYHNDHYYNGFWFPAGAFIAGALIGGAIANSNSGYYDGGSAHVQWCYDRYRSYRAYDNTFQPYNGPRRQCYSPYS